MDSRNEWFWEVVKVLITLPPDDVRAMFAEVRAANIPILDFIRMIYDQELRQNRLDPDRPSDNWLDPHAGRSSRSILVDKIIRSYRATSNEKSIL